jgi:hypothetical protein
MSIETSTFLKKLIQSPNSVITSAWLKEQGISHQLLYKYKQSGWLASIGQGVFLKFYVKKAKIEDALSALQRDSLKIHVGGQFALSLKGKLHYAKVKNNWSIFSNRDIKLPLWFVKYPFDDSWKHYKTKFLSDNIGLEDYQIEGLNIQISSLERAVLELLYQVPKDVDLQEAYEICELLRTLLPQQLQQLLENCSSIKVKRLFLYMAQKLNHSWLQYINLEKVNLGNGTRVISKNGVFNKKI